MLKKCTKCKEEKPLELFYARKSATDGRISSCKECKKKLLYSWRAKNADKWREYAKEHQKLPHQAKRIAAYIASPKAKLLALARERSDKTKATRKAWREKNKEWIASWYRDKNHRYRIGLKRGGAVVSHADWLALIEQHKNKCFYCDMEKKLTMDHKIPISRGGLHCIENIVPACMPCNAAKHSRTPEEFFELLAERNKT